MKRTHGDRVVLAKGSHNKRQYNGKRAVVSEYPAKGAWMTVQLEESPDHPSQKIKWRKRGYSLSLPRVDFELSLLEDDVMIHILSFLGSKSPTTSKQVVIESGTTERAGDGDTNQLLWVKDAAKLHTQIASVCSRWKDICDRNLRDVLGLLNADTDALPMHTIIPCILWMCKYKLALGSLKVEAELEDIALLKYLLITCDTSHLTKVRAYIDREGRNLGYYQSEWIGRAFYRGHPFIDLTDGEGLPPFQTMVQALGIPFHPTTQKDFHDTLAMHCPSVTNLAVTVAVPTNKEELRTTTNTSALPCFQ